MAYYHCCICDNMIDDDENPTTEIVFLSEGSRPSYELICGVCIENAWAQAEKELNKELTEQEVIEYIAEGNY